MAPECPDDKKYAVVEALVKDYSALAAKGEKLLGQTIASVVTVNGVRVTLEDGTWGLVRASSNKPSLVVVVESPASEANMRAMFADIDARLAKHPERRRIRPEDLKRMEEPDEDHSNIATIAGLVAVIALVVLAVWLLIAFQHSSNTLDCLAAHHPNCVPVQ